MYRESFSCSANLGTLAVVVGRGPMNSSENKTTIKNYKFKYKEKSFCTSGQMCIWAQHHFLVLRIWEPSCRWWWPYDHEQTSLAIVSSSRNERITANTNANANIKAQIQKVKDNHKIMYNLKQSMHYLSSKTLLFDKIQIQTKHKYWCKGTQNIQMHKIRSNKRSPWAGKAKVAMGPFPNL